MVNGECGRIYVAKDAAAGGWTDIICNILISTGYYSLRLLSLIFFHLYRYTAEMYTFHNDKPVIFLCTES